MNKPGTVRCILHREYLGATDPVNDLRSGGLMCRGCCNTFLAAVAARQAARAAEAAGSPVPAGPGPALNPAAASRRAEAQRRIRESDNAAAASLYGLKPRG